MAQNSEGVRHLGEFGVVFLMFAIGLEFSLSKLRAMRRFCVRPGAAAGGPDHGAGPWAARCCWGAGSAAHGTWAGRTALALAGTMAMSSTAIVVKIMAERAELESEHGRRVLGILLFQDLAVVPLSSRFPRWAATLTSCWWPWAWRCSRPWWWGGAAGADRR